MSNGDRVLGALRRTAMAIADIAHETPWGLLLRSPSLPDV